MSTERKVAIAIKEQDIQWVEQAVLDEDGESALEYLKERFKPQIEEVMNRPGCKPVFEWDTGEELRPSGPPDAPEESS